MNHLAQLRHDYDKFLALNTEVLVMVPNGPFMISRYVGMTKTLYPILSDKGSKVAGEYMQLKRFFAVGTPTVFLVDRQGVIRYAHYAMSVIDEPDNREPLEIMQEMHAAHSQPS